ncbi:hypothetical protein RUND412_011239 [Rhizina undulata]
MVFDGFEKFAKRVQETVKEHPNAVLALKVGAGVAVAASPMIIIGPVLGAIGFGSLGPIGVRRGHGGVV